MRENKNMSPRASCPCSRRWSSWYFHELWRLEQHHRRFFLKERWKRNACLCPFFYCGRLSRKRRHCPGCPRVRNAFLY
ncbi:hypothetical protein SAMD00023353_3500240 [Rosellinia necatrix]|uniref:Uncharacterized protein n=1 Tax=Rosellinia necatrix TaxID=77044 RepID=A0A1S8A921_ROSNE|nr:hypothetical protein SAMD00023353_3500240 [Rosellinia necatrix]